MKRIALALLAGAVGTGALASATAVASGPAPPPKDIFVVECEGVGPITIAAPASEGGHGAAQIVGEKGHGVPVSSTVSVTDVTKGTVLFSQTDAKGGGAGNHNQTATPCSGTDAEVPASTFFGERGLELPEGVSPADVIRAFTESQVVITR